MATPASAPLDAHRIPFGRAPEHKKLRMHELANKIRKASPCFPCICAICAICGPLFRASVSSAFICGPGFPCICAICVHLRPRFAAHLRIGGAFREPAHRRLNRRPLWYNQRQSCVARDGFGGLSEPTLNPSELRQSRGVHASVERKPEARLLQQLHLLLQVQQSSPHGKAGLFLL